jgi:hypothetical protein
MKDRSELKDVINQRRHQMNKFFTNYLKSLVKAALVLCVFAGTAGAQTQKMDMSKHVARADNYSGGLPKVSAKTVVANGATVAKFDSASVLNWDAKTVEKYGAREMAEAQPVNNVVVPQTANVTVDLKAQLAQAQSRYEAAKAAKKQATKAKNKAAKKRAQADMKAAKAEIAVLRKRIKASGQSATTASRVTHSTVKTTTGGVPKSSGGTTTK